MCGIAGYFGSGDSKLLREMLDSIRHRGPDDEGLFVDGNIGLGHTRLSILDLSSSGHQPMFDLSGRYCIIHNGEIYNYLELKQELSAKYNFVTRTDTEVILYAFREWGVECIHRFNGR